MRGMEGVIILAGVVPGVWLLVHSFPPFLTTSRFPRISGGFLERRIPGKNGGGTPRIVLETRTLAPLL